MFIIWLLPVWETRETSAGRTISQSFDRRQKRKFLLAHENNSTQQRVSEKVKTNSSLNFIRLLRVVFSGGGGGGSYFPYILLNGIQTMLSQLAKRSAKILPAYLCTDHAHYVKIHGSKSNGNENMAVEGRTDSQYYILVIRKFIDFMSLFRHSVWFSFSVKQFSSAEFGICNIQLRTADRNRRRARVELPSSVLLQSLGKLKSRYRAFSSSCDLFIRIVLNFNFGFKMLTDRNKRSEML